MFFALQQSSEVDSAQYLVGDSITKKPFSLAEAVNPTQPHNMKALIFIKKKYKVRQFIIHTTIFKKIYTHSRA